MGRNRKIKGAVSRKAFKPLASLAVGLIDALYAEHIVDEIRFLYASMQRGEPVKHVFLYRLREGLEYIRKHPGASGVIAYVLAREFFVEAEAMQWRLELE